jgi:iron complex outermembrane receptor protein
MKDYLKLSLVAVLSLAFTSPATFAQDAEADVEEVVVTGSRIQDPNIISSSQIATVTGEDIINRGITRVEDYLNDMPQISPGQSITNSNGASGTATANLRNLGCSRTLVLMNGKRLVPGTTGGGNCADLNTIPTLLLDRVEVLTGGASSVYGSDAVAGVVNFILDSDFEGFKASYSHGFYNHENDNSSLRSLVESYNYEKAPSDVQTGETDKFSIAFGGSIGDRGHVTAFIEHTDTKPILQGEYDISACALSGGVSRCGGSSTIPNGRWADFGGYDALGFVNVDPSVTGVDWKVIGDEFVPRAGQTFNYNPTNFFQRPDDRVNMGFFGSYEINDNAEFYFDVTHMKSESNAQIAFSGTFGNISEVPCYNALWSAQQYQAACGDWTGMGGDHAPDFASAADALAYIANLNIAVGNGDIIDYKAPIWSLKRNVEGLPRQAIYQYRSWNQTVGLRGDLNDDWSYDVYFQTSKVDFSEEYRNDLSVLAINRAMDVVSVNGVPTCVSVLNGTDSSCVPYNLFSGGMPGDDGIQGVIDGGQELQNYIANATYVNGAGDQEIFSAYLTGDTGISIPGAPSSISMVVGIENRELSTDYRPDLPSRTGDRSGSGGATLPIGGGYDVDEWYFELGIPVRDNLSVDAGFRSADYSTGQDTETWKVGAYWTVNDKLAVRAASQTSIRHANISELYDAIGFGLVDLDDDPCSGSRGTPLASQQQCLLTGLPANLYGTDLTSPADQYNTLSGGNPNVAPEEAESLTMGVVLTDLIPGLTMTIDYFDITVEDGIGTVAAKTALDQCIATGAAAFCNLITRNPINGSLWLTGGYIAGNITNISEESTSGVDVIFDYDFETQWGPVSVQGITTFLDAYDIIEIPGAATITCAGNWGGSCGKNPQPEVAGKYDAKLSTAMDLDVTLGLRYLGETDDLNSNQIDFGATTYLDLTLQYFATDNLVVTFGVNNLLDKEPEYTSDAGTAPGNGNTFPGYFDAFGQYVFLNLALKY